MERQESRLGCLVASLGLVLGACLLPYLISSIYSIANTVWRAGGAANWLWGDWINSWVEGDRTLYMILSEGPMCCVGAIAVLIVAVGVISHLGATGAEDMPEGEDEFQDGEQWDSAADDVYREALPDEDDGGLDPESDIGSGEFY